VNGSTIGEVGGSATAEPALRGGVRYSRSDRLAVDPVSDRDGIEAEQVAPLDIWDATLGNQSTYVPDRHAEVLSDGDDVDQAWDAPVL
jgi:hypothetical protein